MEWFLYEKYVKAGWIPVKINKDKTPLEPWKDLGKQGLDEDTRDSRLSRYNVEDTYSFMPPPHMLVIDVDVKNGKQGMESFEKFKKDTNISDIKYNVKTGSGGFHYYCFYPTDIPYLQKIQPHYPDIDFIHHGVSIVVGAEQALNNGVYNLNPEIKLNGNAQYNYKSNTNLLFKGDPRFIIQRRNGIIKDLYTSCFALNYSNLTIEEVKQCLRLIDPDEYCTWIQVGMILKQHLGEEGAPLYMEWSKSNDKFKSEYDVIKHWTSFQIRDINIENAVTYGTLIYKALETKYTQLCSELYNCQHTKDITEVMKNEKYTEFPRFTNEFIFNRIPGFIKKIPTFRHYTKPKIRLLCELALNPEEDVSHETKARQSFQDNIFSNIIRLIPVTDKNHFHKLDTDTNIDSLEVKTIIKPYVEELAELYGVKKFTPEFAVTQELIRSAEIIEYDPGVVERYYVNSIGQKIFNKYNHALLPPLVEEKTEQGQKFIQVLLNHAELLLGKPRAELVLSFFAYLVQNPGKKIKWMPIIQGSQGIGKTLLMESLATCLVGKLNFKTPSSTVVNEGYTDWALESALIIIPEFKISTSKADDIMEFMKTLITDDYISYTQKYKRSQSVPNRVNLIATTNHKTPVPIDHDSRRYNIMYSQIQNREEIEKLTGNSNYFHILNDIKSCSPEIAGEIRYFFMHYKLSPNFNPDVRPSDYHPDNLNDNLDSRKLLLKDYSKEHAYVVNLIESCYRNFPTDYVNENVLNDKDSINLSAGVAYNKAKLPLHRLESIMIKIGYRKYRNWYYHSRINEADAVLYVDDKEGRVAEARNTQSESFFS